MHYIEPKESSRWNHSQVSEWKPFSSSLWFLPTDFHNYRVLILSKSFDPMKFEGSEANNEKYSSIFHIMNIQIFIKWSEQKTLII